MYFEVSKSFRFEAAHSLPHLPEGHKCRRVHGHSYRFEVVCRGQLDDRGMVVDYAEISRIVDPIVDRVDHQNLNEIMEKPTTAEHLAEWLWKECIPLLGRWLHQIRVYETATTCVRYPAR